MITYPHYVALYYKYNDSTKHRLPRQYRLASTAAGALRTRKAKGDVRITFTYRVDSPEDKEHQDAKGE
jgi:hypothetical protein